ncbi:MULTISPECIES: response regulator [Winogradskyella]|uniref:DNA-binding NarL/FixJ family response regulator n=2 Tax=Winogradskyella TaxID=286104 RepID=A0A368ZJF6_9FLAO|nr:response regulator [Winogradskyella arenosi]RCW93912.1 DNA-binding NarL/FixJ family response regulator [Winogradskyella arenosi]
MEHIKILMVDDHPIIIEGYQNVLTATKKDDQTLYIDTANNCDTAVAMMERASKKYPYHVCFFDISLPGSEDGKYASGEDLALLARELMPRTKIVILTMFNETFRIHNIVKEINPDGFLIKSDLTSMELADGFQQILESPPYYSSTVQSYIKKTITSDIYVDDINRKILHLLAQGIRTKNLNEYFDISTSAIEKRKKQLKVLFEIEDGKDETLLKEAREKGYL